MGSFVRTIQLYDKFPSGLYSEKLALTYSLSILENRPSTKGFIILFIVLGGGVRYISSLPSEHTSVEDFQLWLPNLLAA